MLQLERQTLHISKILIDPITSSAQYFKNVLVVIFGKIAASIMLFSIVTLSITITKRHT
jgi:hypothetical protein